MQSSRGSGAGPDARPDSGRTADSGAIVPAREAWRPPSGPRPLRLPGSDGLGCGPVTSAGLAAVGFTAIGATVGLIGGASASTLVWGPVESAALDVRAHASPHGLGLQLR